MREILEVIFEPVSLSGLEVNVKYMEAFFLFVCLKESGKCCKDILLICQFCLLFKPGHTILETAGQGLQNIK